MAPRGGGGLPAGARGGGGGLGGADELLDGQLLRLRGLLCTGDLDCQGARVLGVGVLDETTAVLPEERSGSNKQTNNNATIKQ